MGSAMEDYLDRVWAERDAYAEGVNLAVGRLVVALELHRGVGPGNERTLERAVESAIADLRAARQKALKVGRWPGGSS